jgi:hypothetical protein
MTDDELRFEVAARRGLTAPAGDGPRTDTADVARLAQTIRDRINARPVWTAERLAEALLAGPVDAMRREYAAEQLETAARSEQSESVAWRLDCRAAALRAGGGA